MNDGWISALERPPKPEDGDPQGCVLIWHRFQGVMVTGWHNIPRNRFITHWMPTPKAPSDVERM
jgi:hypothetical protein